MLKIVDRQTSASAYDAIVIGSGPAGSWAAKELTERGIETLIVERGVLSPEPRAVIPGTPDRQPIQRQCWMFDDTTSGLFVDDVDNPYVCAPGTTFSWIRAHVVGGRGKLWARQVYRFSDLDFEANREDGHGVDWPIRYADVEPWYDRVEDLLGIHGATAGLPQIPDCRRYLPPFQVDPEAADLKQRLERRYGDQRPMTPQRIVAHPGPGLDPALAAAAATGRLSVRLNEIARRIVHDPATGRASGIQIRNASTGEEQEIRARVIFVCASTLESTRLLLLSSSASFPTGLGNSSGTLGRYLMDHTRWAVMADALPDGGHIPPTGPEVLGYCVPRFRNLRGGPKSSFVRGYLAQTFLYPFDGGSSKIGFHAFGEALPSADNFVALDPERVDAWKMPALRITFQWSSNEERMRQDAVESYCEMLASTGYTNVADGSDLPANLHRPGLAIHEMGTARMGRDAATSVLNGHNQCHDVPNVFVTDGACMTSSPCQHPTLTYMALSARAGAFAAESMRRGEL